MKIQAIMISLTNLEKIIIEKV